MIRVDKKGSRYIFTHDNEQLTFKTLKDGYRYMREHTQERNIIYHLAYRDSKRVAIYPFI